jgi:hypothetical protein
MIQCALCGFTDDVEIVSHIRLEHSGIKPYLAVFPDLPVVTPNLFTAIENAVYFGYKDKGTAGFESVLPYEQELLIVSAQNHAAFRSEICEVADF